MSEAKEDLEDAGDKMKSGAKKTGNKIEDAGEDAKDMAKGMIKTIDALMTMTTTTTTTSHLKTTSNDKLTAEVLSKVRQDLSQLDLAN